MASNFKSESQSLESQLESLKDLKFDGDNLDYYHRYESIKNELIPIQETVGEGLINAQANEFIEIQNNVQNNADKEDALQKLIGKAHWMTDHGPDHVATVIDRASDLVGKSGCSLSPYEIYILLLAIQFHDVGNVFGRENHENQIAKIMHQIPDGIMRSDATEKRLIKEIAAAHGGEKNGNKDTISYLNSKSDVPFEVRPQLLAAILRFADELSDDRNRVRRFISMESTNSYLYKNSEIYHQYAKHLIKTRINEGSININFELEYSILKKTYKKKGRDIKLFDEIVERSMKMFNEFIYCSRYMRPYIHIQYIDIDIDVYNQQTLNSICQISYRLKELGYPSDDFRNLSDLCKEITVDGSRKYDNIDGAWLESYITTNDEEN